MVVRGAGLGPTLDKSVNTGPQGNFFDLVTDKTLPAASNQQPHLPGLNGNILDLADASDTQLQKAFDNRVVVRNLAGAVTAPHGS